MCGRFPPGQSLTIRAVAAALRTSSMPVREALRQLVAERALENRANRSFAIPLMSRSSFLDLVNVRSEIEGFAAAQAAGRIDDPTLDRAEEFDRAMLAAEKIQDRDMYIAHNRGFHFTIYEAAGSAVLLPIIETLWLQVGPYIKSVFSNGARAKVDLRRHESVVAALRQRDAARAKEMIAADIVDASKIILQSASFLD
jgi:DNA-binding GntR family transcriptional regulator